MSPKKLSETDKNNILELYRESEATTSTLAEQYGVSSSTISRFLKRSLSLEEYEDLIQKKRLARTPTRRPTTLSDMEEMEIVTEETSSEIKQDEIKEDFSVVSHPPQPIKVEKKNKSLPTSNPIEQLNLFTPDQDEDDFEDEDDDESVQVEVLTLEHLLGEDIGEMEDEDDFEDEDDDEDDDNLEPETTSLNRLTSNLSLEILPLAQADFPKICYLVIDRRSELITRPLKDFRDLGKIPITEVQEQTLPVFDNHRIARRFSNRRERVIKVPDSKVFEKTYSYLQAKGITRILLDGQVYSLD